MTTLKSSIIAAIVFTILFGGYMAIKEDLNTALIAAPIAGVLFGTFMYLFAASKTVKNQTAFVAGKGEKVLHSGPANHFVNAEAVGGRLYLLNDRLYFRSHKFNLQNHELNLPVNQIEEVTFYKTLGIIPNGLAVQSATSIDKFVVSGRKKWKEEIDRLLHIPKAE